MVIFLSEGGRQGGLHARLIGGTPVIALSMGWDSRTSSLPLGSEAPRGAEMTAQGLGESCWTASAVTHWDCIQKETEKPLPAGTSTHPSSCLLLAQQLSLTMHVWPGLPQSSRTPRGLPGKEMELRAGWREVGQQAWPALLLLAAPGIGCVPGPISQMGRLRPAEALQSLIESYSKQWASWNDSQALARSTFSPACAVDLPQWGTEPPFMSHLAHAIPVPLHGAWGIEGVQ